jgi:hypothetical protein
MLHNNGKASKPLGKQPCITRKPIRHSRQLLFRGVSLERVLNMKAKLDRQNTEDEVHRHSLE